MHIDIQAHGVPLAPVLRERVEQRLRFALGRFADSIAAVTVSLADAGGPTGGPERECRIHVAVPPTVLLVKQVAPDLEAALDRAADQASRSVDRELDRRRLRQPAADD